MNVVSNDLDSKARDILRTNDKGSYTVPTAGLYPYQWNWDSAFAALGFSTFDLDRAWVELETLFSGQWANGMVPHIIFHSETAGYFPGHREWGTEHSPPTSGISQPPVAATFMRAIYEQDRAMGKARLAAIFPKLLAWHRWFFAHRNEGGMIVVNHPWESGRDNAPEWDEAMQHVDTSSVGSYTRNDTSHVDPSMRPNKTDYDRFMAIVYAGRACNWDEAELAASGPFRVADPGMTFILLRANRDLLAMAHDLGHDTGEIADWIAALEAGARKLWNPEINAFDALNIRTGNFAGSVSSASFLCWYAGLHDAALLETYDRVCASVRYAMPSHDPASARFEPFRYWRGPVWGIVNTLIGMGLAEMGLTEMGLGERAENLRGDTAEMIARSGFAEYFNPLDGSPAGGMDFTWTAAIWLAWASPTAQTRRG
jgi:mannosylglycerate hydrolase